MRLRVSVSVCVATILLLWMLGAHLDLINFEISYQFFWKSASCCEPPARFKNNATQVAAWQGLRQLALLQNVRPRSMGVVYYIPDGGTTGLADRIRGLTFAYLISVATNRSFTFDLGYACPYAFEDIFEENCVKWKEIRTVVRGFASPSFTRRDFWTGSHENKEIEYLKETDLLQLGNTESIFLKVGGNAWYYNGILQNQRYVKVMQHLLHSREQKIPMYNRMNIAEHLTSALFKTSESFEKEMSSLLRDKSGQRLGLICAHYRHTEINTIYAYCNETCRQHSYTYLHKKAKQWHRYKFFIASDNGKVRDEFQASCPDCDVIQSPGLAGHVGERVSCSVLKRATWDMALLSNCDVMLLSRDSGFALMSRAMRTNQSQEACFINYQAYGAGCVPDEEILPTTSLFS